MYSFYRSEIYGAHWPYHCIEWTYPWEIPGALPVGKLGSGVRIGHSEIQQGTGASFKL